MADIPINERDGIAADARLGVEAEREERYHYQLAVNKKGKQYYTNRHVKSKSADDGESADNGDSIDDDDDEKTVNDEDDAAQGSNVKCGAGGSGDDVIAADENNESGDVDVEADAALAAKLAVNEQENAEVVAADAAFAATLAEGGQDNAAEKPKKKSRTAKSKPEKPSVLGDYVKGEEDFGQNSAMLSFVFGTKGKDYDNGQEVNNVWMSTQIPKSCYIKPIPLPAFRPPRTLMDREALAEHYAQTPQPEAPVWPPPDAERKELMQKLKSGQLKTMDQKQALKEFWRLRHLYPKVFAGDMDYTLLSRIQYECWKSGYVAKWKDMQHWLNQKATVVSIGSLPTSIEAIATEVATTAQDEEQSAFKALKGKDELAELAQEAEKAEKAIIKAKQTKRYVPPQRSRNIHDRMALRQGQPRDEQGRPMVDQNEEVTVKMRTIKVPRFLSRIVFDIHFNYKDPTRPHLQPSVSSSIELNPDNCREGPPREHGATGDYETSHIFHFVEYVDEVEGLFPHTPRKTLEELFRSTTQGQALVLLRLSHNALPVTSNLFTPSREQMPAAHTAVRVAMRNSPYLYVLVRTHPDAFRTRVNRLFEDFKVLAHWDPTLQFFKDTEKTTPNPKNIKPLVEWDRWKIRPNMYFSDPHLMVRWLSLGTVGDELFDANKQMRYSGRAVILPVPHTQIVVRPGVTVSAVYTMSVNIDRYTDRPRLQSGDAFTLEMGHLKSDETPVQQDPAFSGFIKTSFELNSVDRVLAIVFRRTNKEGDFRTEQEIGTVPVEAVQGEVRSAAYRRLFHKGKNVDVTMRGTYDGAVAKTELKNLARITQSKRQLSSGNDTMLWDIYQEFLKFFMGTDYETIKSVPIFADIPEGHRAEAEAALLSACSSTQQKEFASPAIGSGSPMRVHVLTGAPGTGKSKLCHEVAAHYMLHGFMERQDIHARKRFIAEEYKQKGQLDEAYHVNENQFPASDERVLSRTQVLVMAEQNKTVNQLCVDVQAAYDKKCAPSGKHVLVLRFFTESTSHRIVAAEYKQRMEERSNQDTSDFLNPNEDLNREHPLLKALLRHEHPTSNDNLRDDRFTFNVRPFTFGYYVAQIFGIIPMSDALAGKFTPEEIAGYRSTTLFLETMTQMANDNRLDPKATKEAGKAIAHVLKEMIRRCDVLVTTYALAGNNLLRGCLSANILHMEEMTRTSESRLLSIWVAHPFARLKIGNGDHKQMTFKSFGDKNLPTMKQRNMSLLQRLIFNGMSVYSLTHTYRFKNEDLLQIVRLANPGREVNPVPGCFSDFGGKLANYNAERYGIHSSVVIVHLPNAKIQTDANQSSYCLELIIVMCNELKDMVVHFKMEETFVTQTPYLATLHLCELYWQALIDTSTEEDGAFMQNVVFTTTDSYMGMEAGISFLDALVTGHLWKPQRSNVALSRPMHGLTIFLDTDRGSFVDGENVRADSILRRVILYCKDKGWTYNMPNKRIQVMPTFPHLFKNAGADTFNLTPREVVVADTALVPKKLFQSDILELSDEQLAWQNHVDRCVQEIENKVDLKDSNPSKVDDNKDPEKPTAVDSKSPTAEVEKPVLTEDVEQEALEAREAEPEAKKGKKGKKGKKRKKGKGKKNKERDPPSDKSDDDLQGRPLEGADNKMQAAVKMPKLSDYFEGEDSEAEDDPATQIAAVGGTTEGWDISGNGWNGDNAVATWNNQIDVVQNEATDAWFNNDVARDANFNAVPNDAADTSFNSGSVENASLTQSDAAAGTWSEPEDNDLLPGVVSVTVLSAESSTATLSGNGLSVDPPVEIESTPANDNPTEEEHQRFQAELESNGYGMLDPEVPYYAISIKANDPCHSCGKVTGQVLDCWGCEQSYCSLKCITDDLDTCNNEDPDACTHGPNCHADNQLILHTNIYRKEQTNEAAHHGQAD